MERTHIKTAFMLRRTQASSRSAASSGPGDQRRSLLVGLASARRETVKNDLTVKEGLTLFFITQTRSSSAEIDRRVAADGRAVMVSAAAQPAQQVP